MKKLFFGLNKDIKVNRQVADIMSRQQVKLRYMCLLSNECTMITALQKPVRGQGEIGENQGVGLSKNSGQRPHHQPRKILGYFLGLFLPVLRDSLF